MVLRISSTILETKSEMAGLLDKFDKEMMNQQATQAPPSKLVPGSRAPRLHVKIVGGDIWRLSERAPEEFTTIVFYRGFHCPICKAYLTSLERVLGDFARLGVEAIAISGDSLQRAKEAKSEWGLKQLTLGYDQTIGSMRDWGLYVSQGISDSEPSLFGEPGLFLIRPDGTLYYAAINSSPYGRPAFEDLLSGISFAIDRDYPARGTM